MTIIAIVDYEIGNIRSIFSAFESLGAVPKLTRDSSEILNAHGAVLPGVGAYSHGMEKLKHYGLDSVIKDFSITGKPLLGICLGMQLMLSESDEFGHTEGLGLIPGSVKKLNTSNPEVQKLPHVSWNELQVPGDMVWDGTILDGITPKTDMYFVHSFAAVPENENHVLSVTSYSNSQFCSSVKKDNIYGCQFHPEKSAEQGLKVISNFIKSCEVK